MDTKLWENQIHMADVIGTHEPPGPVLTREVRWFMSGPLPEEVVAWFTNGHARSESEVRIDEYDSEAIRQGVGVKRRNGEALDAKYRIVHEQNVDLAPGIVGCVEEWLKVSGPRNDIPFPAEGESIVVSKEIISKKFDIVVRDGVASGCDVELAELTVGAEKAWSLCFETYGDPALRFEALNEGIKRVLRGPLPELLTLEGGSSCGYPAWLSVALAG